MPAQPKPVATAHACSVCGLDWKKHGEKPTLEGCVELLKAQLVQRAQSNEITAWPNKPHVYKLETPLRPQPKELNG